MPRAVPGPGDFVAPGMPVEAGELKPVNDAMFEKMKAELEATERAEQPAPEPPRKVQSGGATASMLDPYQPIKEMARQDEHTVMFVVPDNRPFVTIPLFGPGNYVVTIRRTVEHQVQG